MKLKNYFFMALGMLLSVPAFSAVSIREAGGWLESGYVTFDLVDGASTYAVYYKVSGGEYLKLDSELVRNYGDYGRADALGLTAGNYQFKVVPVNAEGVEMADQAAESDIVEVRAHDRAGFAHLNYSGVGAYQDNGQLKSGAKVLYVTKDNCNTVQMDVEGASENPCIGLGMILKAYEKGKMTTPLAIRIIGNITGDDLDASQRLSDQNGLQLKGKNNTIDNFLTIEGVGNDATLSDFGIVLNKARGVEIRNLGFMLFEDDGISIKESSHLWIHNCDIYYGHAGSAGDQAKGDGSLDVKDDSQYCTFSYIHFWDSGKMSLCGMESESGENWMTYHHNWFDHSDSRHPRVRTMTVHVYNNYYDGVAKYGVGATTGSSVFVESNYFRNTNKPMMISLQGTDIVNGEDEGTFSGETGGIIKSYGNVFAEKSSNFRYVTYQENNVDFDAYEASSRDEQVPSSVKTKKGGTSYNNFDTNASLMYEYTPDAAENVPAIVTGQYGAGRMQHGDFTWTFNNATDDKNYDVDTNLKNALLAYETSLVGIFGSTGAGDTPDPEEPDPDQPGEDDDDPVTPAPDPESGYACWFTKEGPSNSFYTIDGNMSNSKGSVTLNGVTYDYCLKMESSTSITFTISEPMTLTLVFGPEDGTKCSVAINGEKYKSLPQTWTIDLKEGSYELKKVDTCNLFYIDLTPMSDPTRIAKLYEEDATEPGPIYDLSGRIVKNPQPGIYIQDGKKIIIR